MGLGYVEHYLQQGWRVVAASRSAEGSKRLRELEQEHREHLELTKLDLANESSIAALADRLAQYKLDLVINNAGYSQQEDFGQWNASTFEQHFRVNTVAPALVAQALAHRMRQGSKLVNVSSGMGSFAMNINPENGLDAYAISKTALNLLTLRLAAKLRPRGIIVAALNPGWVNTSMGGKDAPTPICQAIASMAKRIELLTMEESGRFYSCEGKEIPW